ncbi:unnamed protein product, partial [Cladocopium goreaui]
FLLSLCQRRRLVDLGTRVLGQSWICLSPGNPLSKVLLSSVKQSAFAHFCGGESLEDCVATGKQLEAHAGVKCIVDWGVEESSDAKFWDSNTERKVKTLHRAKEVLGSNAAFMPIKLTSLLSPALLERITLEVNHDPNAERGMGWQAWQDEPEAADALQRLRCLCEAAKSLAIPLLLDAEQSDRQAAVHLLARHLQAEFNVQEPIVYDTIQMYLKASPQRLEEALDSAERHGYIYAIKLVRGAYIDQERSRGSIHSCKEHTDDAFEAATKRLLQAASQRPRVALMLATHNRASLWNAVKEMDRLGLARDDPRIHFAQILGMVDNLTWALGLAGYNASKLLVFGQVHEVLPWLLRRARENRDAFGAQVLG